MLFRGFYQNKVQLLHSLNLLRYTSIVELSTPDSCVCKLEGKYVETKKINRSFCVFKRQIMCLKKTRKDDVLVRICTRPAIYAEEMQLEVVPIPIL